MESRIERQPQRPLLVTDDVYLLDDLLRLAAAAHIEPDVASSIEAAASRWQGAAAVVIGIDLASAVKAANLPRRQGLILVGSNPGSEGWVTAADLGAGQFVELPAGDMWLVEHFAELATRDRSDAVTLGVIGASGGAGASTLAAALTVAGRRQGVTASAIDLDPLGSGLDLILGGIADNGSGWNDLMHSQGRIPPDPLLAALPTINGIRVLTWHSGPREQPATGAVGAVLDSLRLSCQLIVVDLPRLALNHCLEAISRLDHLLLIAVPEDRSVRAASHLLAATGLAEASPKLVIRAAAGGIGPDRIGAQLDLPVALFMPDDSSLRRDAGLGIAPGERRRGPLAKACGQLLRRLSSERDPR